MEGQSQKTYFFWLFFYQVTGSRWIETTDKMTSEDSEINEDPFLIFCSFVRGCNRKYTFDEKPYRMYKDINNCCHL